MTAFLQGIVDAAEGAVRTDARGKVEDARSKAEEARDKADTGLGDLSDDALPVLATLPQHLAECALAIDGRERDDWLEWNVGRSQARAFIETHADDWQYREECPGQTFR